MKTIPPALVAHYASGTPTLARLWKITRADGALFGFTDHDAEITFGGLTYEPSSAFEASAIATRAELNVDNLEVAGVIDSAGITEADIEAGRWDGAQIEVRQVNWADLTMGAEILRVGSSGAVQHQAGRYSAELRGLKQALQNEVGLLVTANCRANLGDALCKVNLAPFTTTITVASVVDRATFTPVGTFTTGQYTRGHATFTSGANAGVTREVKLHPAGHALQMELPFPFDIVAGDAVTLIEGCDKSKATCIDKFANVVNFRGFSFVPGTDSVMKVIGGE